jgi:hypothetical protein
MFLLFLFASFFTFVSGLGADSQTSSMPDVKQTAPVAAPEHPITIEQLRILLRLTHTIEPMRQLTMEEAERQRKTLPPWFPSSVWDAVEKKILAIDIPQSELTIYQRYFSQDNADALILAFQGPIGEQLPIHFMQRDVSAVHPGTSGAATTARAMEETSHSGDVDLGAKRMNELSPIDRERVLSAIQVVGNVWKPISDELTAPYDDLVNGVVQKEIAAHSQEIQAAQRRTNQITPSRTPATH